MKLKNLIYGILGASAGILIYGALVESNRLVLDRRRLRLKGLPDRLTGYKIAVLADMHLRDEYTLKLANRAVAMALAEEPDIVILPGDTVAYWKEETWQLLEAALAPLRAMNGKVIVTPGNHEYWSGDPEQLGDFCTQYGFIFLRNQTCELDGIQWIGLDSAVEQRANLDCFDQPNPELPAIVVWHEPDAVEDLPAGAILMISGHSHGGQFRLPNGWAPMYTKMGELYTDGFYPDAPTPLYVSRGIGTTGPPSRLFCPPEVSLLTLERAD